MVIEDEADLRRMICGELRRAGYAVTGAADGDRAMQRLTPPAAPPDLVLMDLVLPGKDGWKLLAWLRQQHGDGRPPAVVMSMGAAEDTLERTSGAAGFLEKPFTPDEMLRAVRQHLPPLPPKESTKPGQALNRPPDDPASERAS